MMSSITFARPLHAQAHGIGNHPREPRLTPERGAADQLLDCRRQFRHRADDRVGSGRGEPLGQIVACMARARESDHGHVGRPRGFDAEDGILDDDAARGRLAERPRCQQKEIRRWLAVRDLAALKTSFPNSEDRPVTSSESMQAVGRG